MLNEKIFLRENNEDVYLTTYILDSVVKNQKKRPTIVIFSGGGYEVVSSRGEEPIACEFNSMGFNAVVVKYTVKSKYPQALIDASNAIVYVKKHAEEWNVDIENVFVYGSSAGGHLAASIGVMSGKEEAIKRNDGLNSVKGMILCYPVITSGEFAHRSSFNNIGAVDEELLKKTSMELQVDENTPPAFIWHTFTDDVVPLENSLLFANAMRKHNRQFELHIYPEGKHGLVLASEITAEDENYIVPHVQSWIPLVKAWLKEMVSK